MTTEQQKNEDGNAEGESHGPDSPVAVSEPKTWQAGKTYHAGDVVVSPNGNDRLYVCVAPGKTGPAPTGAFRYWGEAKPDGVIVDGAATWKDAGHRDGDALQAAAVAARISYDALTLSAAKTKETN